MIGEHTLSVIVVQFEPEWNKLRRTLLSLLLQNDQDFELLIADDGSTVNYFEEEKTLLEAHKKSATFISLPCNKGTVWNFWNAVSQAHGLWVYGISPGDYLYDKDVIRWIKSICIRDAPIAGFGTAAYYAESPTLHCLPGQTPCDRSCYCSEHYCKNKIKRNSILYDDGISGACIFYKRERLLSALAKMKGRVRYAEDLAMRLFIMQDIRINCYDRVICWYEAATGVSKSVDKLHKDWQEMLLILRELYPNDFTIQLATLYFFNEYRKSRVLRGLIGRLIVPQWLPIKRRQRNHNAPIIGDFSKLKKLYDL